MRVEFSYNGQLQTADRHRRVIPIQDKAGQIHLAVWGSQDETGFARGLWHSMSYWSRHDPAPTWVPVPLTRYAIRGRIRGFKVFDCPEPLCGALCRLDGKSRVYIVHSDVPGDTVIVPLTYREVVHRKGII